MDRRSILALIGPIGSALAGCAGLFGETPEIGTPTATEDSDDVTPTDGATGDTDCSDGADQSGTDTPTGPASDEFTRCRAHHVSINVLPGPARREVETALDSGAYRTDENLYLSSVIDPSLSCVRAEGRYYRPIIESDNGCTRLTLLESVPSYGLYTLAVQYNSVTGPPDPDDPIKPLSVDIRITRLRDAETVVAQSLSVPPAFGGMEAIVGPFNREFGRYRAEITTEQYSETVTWEEDGQHQPLHRLEVTDSGSELPAVRPTIEQLECPSIWDGSLPKYTQCPRSLISIRNLPEPARLEVEAARQSDGYESADGLFLPQVFDPEKSYLRDRTLFFRATVEDVASGVRLDLERAIPRAGPSPLTLRNDTVEGVTVTTRVKRLRDGATVLQETVTLDSGNEATVGTFDREFTGEYRAETRGDFDHDIGLYRVEIATDRFSDRITWREQSVQAPLTTVVITTDGATSGPRPIAAPIDCHEAWD